MSFSSAIDDLTLASLRRECRQAQERVYRQYASAAWTLALRLSGCEAAAWDALQAAFLRAFERVAQLERADRFGPWLRRIVVNEVMDSGRRKLLPLPLQFEESGSAGDGALGLDLLRALSRLEQRDRAVLWLHDVEGMTHAEIAAALSRSVPWSKTRLSRARGQMRALLGDSKELEPEGRVVTHGH